MVTVGDIMATDVITVTPSTTVRELAQVLSDSQISGVPVIDSKRDIVGVVSSTDIVRFASEAGGDGRTWGDVLDDSKPDYVPSFFRVADNSWFDWSTLAEPTETSMDEITVKDLMTTVPFTVPAETPLHQLAFFLSERKIHRAIVTGPNGLAGIVTAFDVLRAFHELQAPSAQA